MYVYVSVRTPVSTAGCTHTVRVSV